PSGLLVSSDRACASTIGSLSTYTMRAAGATRCATSCVLFAVGRPVPMSRNWRMPTSPARYRTTGAGKARETRATSAISGYTLRTWSPVAQSGEPLIVLDGVDKWFGSLHVLRDVHLTVDRGEVVVVIGPSGSGKSTLCRVINRLEPIDSGTIRFDGRTLPAEGRPLARLRSEVGMVFQSFNLFAHKTVLQNVTLGPVKVRRERSAAARERELALLDRVGIADQADKYP